MYIASITVNFICNCFFPFFSSEAKLKQPFEDSPNPMIFFMISCFSFILLSKSSLNTLPFSSLAWFGRELSHFFMSWLEKTMIPITSSQLSTITPSVNEPVCLKAEKIISSSQEEGKISLLDLPELALESILERLSPPELCSMSRVCTSLRDRCASDHLWERHMKQKWGRLIGDVAYREWQWHIAKRKRSSILSKDKKHKALFGFVSLLWNRSKFITCIEPCSTLPVDSGMAWYLALETGKFWFPAQVYNRENGNVGFVLSCYDAELSYNFITNTFKARYSSPHGRRTIEENLEWDRLRAPAVDTPAHVLHTSDCLDDLKPGDHIEIQWRRNKEFPYSWWYGVVGHKELCGGNKIHCQCHSSDTVILEFKQYTPGSQWRQTTINRKDHREVGNEADGFYGGIRKLYHEEEISVWKRLWPTQVLE